MIALGFMLVGLWWMIDARLTDNHNKLVALLWKLHAQKQGLTITTSADPNAASHPHPRSGPVV